MSSFELEKKISSCYVTKKLIEQLENYLIFQIPEIIDVPQDEIRNEYYLSITDNLGVEKLPSISNYSLSIFHDSTSEISLGFFIYIDRTTEFSIKIRFDRERSYFNIISIAHKSVNAREKVIAIYDGIKRIISTQTNYNKIFYPPPHVDVILSLLLFATGMSSAVFFLKNFISPGFVSFIISLSIIIYFSIGKKLKPYTSFESKYYLNLKKWSDFIIYGFLGFLLFGTLLVILRKKIFGF
jgi:hypothetical protein